LYNLKGGGITEDFRGKLKENNELYNFILAWILREQISDELNVYKSFIYNKSSIIAPIKDKCVEFFVKSISAHSEALTLIKQNGIESELKKINDYKVLKSMKSLYILMYISNFNSVNKLITENEDLKKFFGMVNNYFTFIYNNILNNKDYSIVMNDKDKDNNKESLCKFILYFVYIKNHNDMVNFMIVPKVNKDNIPYITDKKHGIDEIPQAIHSFLCIPIVSNDSSDIDKELSQFNEY
jgi:hypothetical protein